MGNKMVLSIAEIIQSSEAHRQIEERLNKDLAAIQSATKKWEIIGIRQAFLNYIVGKLGYHQHWQGYYSRILGAEIERLRDPRVGDI